MAVRVTTSEGPRGDNTTTFEAGGATFVVDGHLYVQSVANQSISDTVAIFAPGSWMSAEVLGQA